MTTSLTARTGLQTHARSPHEKAGRTRHRALVASGVVGVLLLAQSLAGLLVAGLYGAPVSTAQILRGYDWTTLLVALPALAGALVLRGRDRTVAGLVAVGVLAYAAYAGFFYVFATGFNDLFLLHVTTLDAAVVALGLVLPTLAAAPCPRRRSARPVAVVLALLGAGLGIMWVVAALVQATTGTVPAGSTLVESDQLLHVGMAVDLVLLVPSYLAAAVLLWRGVPWAVPLAAVALVAGLLHQVAYLAAMPLQVAADVPGAHAWDPFEPVIVAAYVVGVVVLLRGVRHPTGG